MKLSITGSELRHLYEDRGLSAVSIAKMLGCGATTIGRKLDEFNIAKRTSGIPHQEHILTDTQNQVLIGALLGDGYISNRHNRNSYFQYTSIHEDAVRHIADYFKELWPGGSDMGCHSYPFKKNGRIYQRRKFVTTNNIVFTKLRRKWYPNNKKIVPDDVILTPLMCSIWYQGDGSICNSKNYKGNIITQHIRLYTNGFIKKDVEFLVDQLITFEPRLYMTSGRLYPIISIPRRKIKDFLDYIGECPIDCYKYKWAFEPYKVQCYKTASQDDCVKYRDDIISLYNGGMSCSMVAKTLGLNSSSVKYHLKSAGIYRGQHKLQQMVCCNPDCNVPFAPNTTNQKYCSVACKHQHYKIKRSKSNE